MHATAARRRVGILIQARLASTRFPGKMLAPLGGMPLLECVYRRLAQLPGVDLLAVVTSDQHSDDRLHAFCLAKGFSVFRGPQDDVLKRYALAADFFDLDAIIRVCGDSPWVSQEGILGIIDTIHTHNPGYVFQINGPDGFKSEGIRRDILQMADENFHDPEEREHVTKGIVQKLEASLKRAVDLHMPWHEACKFTIDLPSDLMLARKLLDVLQAPYRMRCEDIMSRYSALPGTVARKTEGEQGERQ